MDAPIYNPRVPYSDYINGGFRPGRMVRVQGSILPQATGFTINLQTGPNASQDDIGLHFNPRFHEHTVVRNAKNYGNWGAEERHGPSPFVPGQHFEVMIMSEPHQYKIAVNGQHFTEFNHRVPVDRIAHLVVEGDVTLSVIRFEGAVTGGSGSGYAPTGPPVTAGAPYPPSSAPPMGLVAPPYPPAGGSMYPPPSAPGYPSAPPPAYGAPAGYPPPPQGHGYAPQPGYGGSPYPTQPGPGYAGHPGGYPPPQGQGYGYPSSPSGHQKSGGLLDNAGKLLAGGLAGVGLAKVANKIPGMGGHGNHGGQYGGHGGQYGGHGYPGQAPGGHGGGGGGGGGILGGALGTAAALGAGGLLAGKGLKKQKKNKKLLKYGLPLAGVGLGGYALSKGLKHKGHGYGGHSSSSSSSSSEEE